MLAYTVSTKGEAIISEQKSLWWKWLLEQPGRASGFSGRERNRNLGREEKVSGRTESERGCSKAGLRKKIPLVRKFSLARMTKDMFALPHPTNWNSLPWIAVMQNGIPCWSDCI